MRCLRQLPLMPQLKRASRCVMRWSLACRSTSKAEPGIEPERFEEHFKSAVRRLIAANLHINRHRLAVTDNRDRNRAVGNRAPNAHRQLVTGANRSIAKLDHEVSGLESSHVSRHAGLDLDHHAMQICAGYEHRLADINAQSPASLRASAECRLQPVQVML